MDSNLFDEATRTAREKNKKDNREKWVPQFSRFKLQFKMRDGSTSSPYHSYDIHRAAGGKNVTDEQIGLAKLILLVDKRRVLDNYVVATIWANITDDLRTYVAGRMNMNYDFIVFKHVRGQNPFSSKLLKFNHGKVDIDLLKRSLAL